VAGWLPPERNRRQEAVAVQRTERLRWIEKQRLTALSIFVANTAAILEALAADDPEAGLSVQVDWHRFIEGLRETERARQRRANGD
jgi:hypothetical protein